MSDIAIVIVVIAAIVVALFGVLTISLMITAGRVSRMEAAGLLTMPAPSAPSAPLAVLDPEVVHEEPKATVASTDRRRNPAQVLSLTDQGLLSGFLSGGVIVNALIESDTFLELPLSWSTIDQQFVDAVVLRCGTSDVHLLVRKQDIPAAAWHALLQLVSSETNVNRQSVTVVAWHDDEGFWHETNEASLIAEAGNTFDVVDADGNHF